MRQNYPSLLLLERLCFVSKSGNLVEPKTVIFHCMKYEKASSSIPIKMEWGDSSYCDVV